MSENVLEMKNITKSFFGVNVLHDVQLSVNKGEVHILLGENGAGKSTLIKILSGAYTKEEGSIVLDGEELKPMLPREAIEKGISVIYQEFNLVPDMPIYENIFLGKEQSKKKIAVDHKNEIAQAKEYMEKVGLNVSPKTLVSQLSVAKKQLVEIAKAISNDVKVLVLDEPTAAITDKETEMLFEIIRELKRQGIGIIYISHRMSELFEIGDVCTVMRDGGYVGTVNIKDTNENELTEMMVGRKVSFDRIENHSIDKDQVILSVKNLCYKDLVKNVSFDLHKGEILGFAGLVGAGRTETAKTIIGNYKKDSGEVNYKGKPLGTDLSKNIKDGIVYLSEDRKDEGLFLIHSVMDNIALPNLNKLCAPFMNRRKAKDVSNDYVRDLKIKTFSEMTEAKNLSGGNQQKVVIAKWLYSDADVYIFDEPTRGIDVGARDEIYNIMYELIKKKASIIMISSDLVEVLKMSDRVVVMREGRVQKILENDGNLTQKEVLRIELAEDVNYDEN
ncbi:MAG: sugar ABC transporter ATP-binding protein [Christensenella sp.]|nr:sugar ABC transporter ATP-binding protein [Christensenella sp.]